MQQPNSDAAELLSNLLDSVEETVCLATDPEAETLNLTSALPVFAAFVERLAPILHGLPQTEDSATPAIRKAVEALGTELRRARALVRSSAGSPVAVRLMEGCARDLGRCLGLFLDAWGDALDEVKKEEIGGLQREMMGVRFGGSKGREVVDVEDLVVRVKSGDEDELGVVLLELGILITDGLVTEEGVCLIPVLLIRLASAKSDNRLKIILLLRSLAFHSDENKERMAGIEALSSVVKSLSRDVDESRQAVGLLLDLSVVVKVRQRLGRIQGCIVMLVALLNGDDPSASCDARKLLCALSSNSQNVLLMAEAGYFMPLLRYLKEGSDMHKILMATAISRMELTDQMKAVLGEEGSIEPLVKMFISGNLEAKLSALGALRNLSSLAENIPLLISSGIVAPLLQLLFSVTSVLMTLREPASAILASLAQSELILTNKDVAQQMLSLLNLSSPTIQSHLLHALNSIASHSKAKRARAKMKENGAVQLLLPFLTESNVEIRNIALKLLFNLSKDFAGELTEQLGETQLNILVNIISASASDSEKAGAVGILSSLPVNDKKATEILTRLKLLPVLISLLGVSISASSTPTRRWLLESIAGVMIRFTVPWDKKLQKVSAAHGVIPCLVKLLSSGSVIAKSRAATSLAQLSQNSLALCKVKSSRWFCIPPSSETLCEVHRGNCIVKNTFCLVKAGALSPLVQILEGKEREADEAVLSALATLMQDELWENGSNTLDKAGGIQALIRILGVGSLKSQEKAIWMLERIFRLPTYREQYGETAQNMLIDLAQKGDPTLKPMIAKILAHLQLLLMQSSYF
ncbi:U-box domain-containing protein 44-like [Phoenix dactylifera]|uniref:U-box domain-containing protein 44-like n=1 Tax=Phoenix dactylifera TaxID=42345 RepID=A0A8B7CJE2_PHODC|nr:U-box domain-containing protein 44-like [Phoenix dactylifera]